MYDIFLGLRKGLKIKFFLCLLFLSIESIEKF